MFYYDRPNFIMLQEDDLEKAIRKILQEMGIVGPVMAQPSKEADAEYLTRNEVCARLHDSECG